MRERTKLWLSIATFLIGAGLVGFAVVMTFLGWDFTKLDTYDYTEKTIAIDSEFDNFTLNLESADVCFEPSLDGTCSVVGYYPEEWAFSASAESGALSITLNDPTEWYDRIGIMTKSPKITVYLPKTEYRNLTVEGQSGDIEISGVFKFHAVDVNLSTGDAVCRIPAADSIKIKTSTGEIKLQSVSCTGDINLESSTGDITLSAVSCDNLAVSSSTGDIRFDRCSARSLITVDTSTGDVNGSFTHSLACEIKGSGDIKAPSSEAGVPCRITSGSGDITLTIAEPTPVPTVPVTVAPTEIVTPTPEETRVTILSNPQYNSVPMSCNRFVLYPEDATLVVIVKRSESGGAWGTEIGGIDFGSETYEEPFIFRIDDTPAVGEEVTFTFRLGDVLSAAQSHGASTFTISVGDTAGYTLVGADIIYKPR